ncbi:MAG: preprotein translocase subunit SecA [Chlamydiales bacterium]|jgi:preprotein translocase subunit SecA|nr:preprotein translocase subunit SecA [Chlamydiales bacterium]
MVSSLQGGNRSYSFDMAPTETVKVILEKGLGVLPADAILMVDSLSHSTINFLVQAFSEYTKFKGIIEVWYKVLKVAYDKGMLRELDRGILSCIGDLEIWYDPSIPVELLKVVSKERGYVEAFLVFASVNEERYYKRVEFLEVLKSFKDIAGEAGDFYTKDWPLFFRSYKVYGPNWLTKFHSEFDKIKRISHRIYSSNATKSSYKIMEQHQLSWLYPGVLQYTFNTSSYIEQRFSQGLFDEHDSYLINSYAQYKQAEELTKFEADLIKLMKLDRWREVFNRVEQLMLLQIFDRVDCSIASGKTIIICLKAYSRVRDELGGSFFFLLSRAESFHKKDTVHDIIGFLQQLLAMKVDVAEAKSILMLFYEAKIELQKCRQLLSALKTQLYLKKLPAKSIQDIVDEFSLTSFPLSQSECQALGSQADKVIQFGVSLGSQDTRSLVDLAQRLKDKKETLIPGSDEALMLLAVGREVLRRKNGLYAHVTQVIAILGLVNFPNELKGRIAQMATGEGKSLVVTLLAFYLAMSEHFVDIISSSRYLAKRDREKFSDFFDEFGVLTTDICNDDLSIKNFAGRIIYGTNYDFEFALMRDRLFQRNLRKVEFKGQLIDRPFDVVIVDEVDNLFIDSALNSARIAIPQKVEFNWIYPAILSFVSHNYALVQRSTIFQGHYADCDYEPSLIQALRNTLKMQPNQHEVELVDSFTHNQFKMWINSALNALERELDIDYVIKDQECFNSMQSKGKKRIVIVDKSNTGRLSEMSRWNRGLHQFIEAKHHLNIEGESLMPASLCHPVFFNYYQNIYGLTGTMGGETERKEVETLYRVGSFDVPPFRVNQKKILPPIIADSEENFLRDLIEEIQSIRTQQRPLLILFESITESYRFFTTLRSREINCQLLNERQAEHEDYVIMRAGKPGMVTIATNTAGRGTDIVLEPICLQKGGLHVVFTFYPSNKRVEAQGFGRAARQGQPGSARLILPPSDPFVNAVARKKVTLPMRVGNMPMPIEIKELESFREEKIKEGSMLRVLRARYETVNHTYLDHYFNLISKWTSLMDQNFLKNFARAKIAEVVKTMENGVPSELIELDHSWELELRKGFFAYVESTQKPTDDALYQFLEKVKQALLDYVTETWSLLFYDKLDELMEEVSIFSIGEREEQVKLYTNKIKELYLSRCKHWEDYLVNPHKIFKLCLRRITGLACFNE